MKIITKKLRLELGDYIKDLSKQIAELHDKMYTGNADEFDMEHLHELQGEYEAILSNPQELCCVRGESVV